MTRERVRRTLVDVAKAAGVSIATVDRVLNRRPGVRHQTMERVEAAMSRLGYVRDPVAARLARGATYRFAFLLPEGSNTFMGLLAAQVEGAAAMLEGQRGSVEIHRVDVFDAEKLSHAIETLAPRYDGLAVVALDHPRVRAAIDDAIALGTAIVTLVSDAPASKRARFIGIDNSAAGRTAATLMGRFLSGCRGSVAIILGSLGLRDHAERFFGFGQVMAAEYPHLTILPPCEGRDDGSRNADLVRDLLSAHPDLIGIYSAGAGTRGLAGALKEAGRAADIVFIGHELTEHSRRYLLDGTMDAVINQDPGHEARSAARILLATCAGEPIIADQERIRIDIFLRDNMP